MAAKNDLQEILQSLEPTQSSDIYVFVTLLAKSLLQVMGYDPLATFQEEEGTTLILKKESADNNNLIYDSQYRKITLNVHSSLNSVGLTAIVTSALAKAGISVNVWAGFYHDHLFVPLADADTALGILLNMQKSIQALAKK